MTVDLVIRPLHVPEELDYLDEVVYLACTWWEPTDDRPHPSRQELLQKMAVYRDDWGREGDACLIAEVDGQKVGGAFYRRFTADVPSQAFLDEDTPELGIACAEGQRGTGIGRALMVSLLALARLEGHEQICLAVSDGNFSKHLYDSVGFVDHERLDGKGWRMLRTLGGSR